MVRSLLAIVRAVQSVWLLEIAGAGLVVAGAWLQWSLAVALMVAGVLLLLKAFDVQLGEQ